MSSSTNKTGEEVLLSEKAFLQAEKTCTEPWVLYYSIPLPGVPIHFHELMTILGPVACILSTALSIYLIFGHLFHWTKGREQKQFVRIIAFVPAFSLTALFSIWFYEETGWLQPVGQYYEGFAITACFLLLVECVTPDPNTREVFFHSLERRWWITGKKKGTKGSLRWFHGVWAMVFQITFTRILTIPAQWLLYGLTCPLAQSRYWGQFTITAIQGTSTGIAVTGVVIFERRLKKELKPYGAMFKLLSFKGVVGIEGFQSFWFPLLAYKRVFFPKPPYQVS